MWVKVNVGENGLCKLVWRECVQRALMLCFNEINETTFLYKNVIIKIISTENVIEIVQVVLVTLDSPI